MSRPPHTIETIARGVLVADGHVLVCRGRKHNNLYLPGGHIEFGETGAEALAREMVEEAGLKVDVTTFLGCAEHFFVQETDEHEPNADHAEINLVYAMTAPGLSPDREVKALEGWIAFDWIPLADFAATALEPATLRKRVPGWIAELDKAADRLATSPKVPGGFH